MVPFEVRRIGLAYRTVGHAAMISGTSSRTKGVRSALETGLLSALLLGGDSALAVGGVVCGCCPERKRPRETGSPRGLSFEFSASGGAMPVEAYSSDAKAVAGQQGMSTLRM
jgi:hypothetical protein